MYTDKWCAAISDENKCGICTENCKEEGDTVDCFYFKMETNGK